MNTSKQQANADIQKIDTQVVAASLCFLMTRYQKTPTHDLSLVIKNHLQILLQLRTSMSQEAGAIYQDILFMWRDMQTPNNQETCGYSHDKHYIH